MTKTEYAEYLCSEHWKARRKQALIDGGNKCYECEMPRWLAQIVYDQDLNVHHLSYARLGAELPDDLQCLCLRCHEVETFGRTDIPLLKSAQCANCHSMHWNRYSDICDQCAAITTYRLPCLLYNNWESLKFVMGCVMNAAFTPPALRFRSIRQVFRARKKFIREQEALARGEFPF